jgi:hypothetical protein
MFILSSDGKAHFTSLIHQGPIYGRMKRIAVVHDQGDKMSFLKASKMKPNSFFVKSITFYVPWKMQPKKLIL